MQKEATLILTRFHLRNPSFVLYRTEATSLQ